MSTYLEDGGLWTACRESRWALQQKAVVQKCDPSYSYKNSFDDFTYECYPMTGLFQDEQRTSPRWLTTYPDRDLFVLSPGRLHTFTELKIIIGPGKWRFDNFESVAF